MNKGLEDALREGARHVLWTTMQLPAEEATSEYQDDHAAVRVEARSGKGHRLTLAAGSETADRLVSLFSGREAGADDDACEDALTELASMILSQAIAIPHTDSGARIDMHTEHGALSMLIERDVPSSHGAPQS